MNTVSGRVVYYLLYSGWYLLSLLPMWFHYLMSDVLYVIIGLVIRYRRRVVDKNLRASFPEMSDEEIVRLRRRFYRFFCDYIAETVKFATMKMDNIKRRMKFHGMERVIEALNEGKSIAMYLGHYGNWEMVTSIRQWLGEMPNGGFGHVYHPLENEVFDRLFLTFRNRMGSQSIAMNDILRWIITQRQGGHPTLVGYISDQVPLWWNIHHWTTFMNQDTPVLTGVERIARRERQAVIYLDIVCVKRGYYEGTIRWITDDASTMPEFAITDEYFRLLETTIRRAPQYWLWSHNRWKRTREEFDRLYEIVNGRVVERKQPLH